jgi:hypothetical protein
VWSGLEQQWDNGDNVSAEDLRLGPTALSFLF